MERFQRPIRCRMMRKKKRRKKKMRMTTLRMRADEERSLVPSPASSVD